MIACTTHDIHAINDGAPLQTSQPIQGGGNVEVDWVQYDLSEAQVCHRTRVTYQFEACNATLKQNKCR